MIKKIGIEAKKYKVVIGKPIRLYILVKTKPNKKVEIKAPKLSIKNIFLGFKTPTLIILSKKEFIFTV